MKKRAGEELKAEELLKEFEREVEELGGEKKKRKVEKVESSAEKDDRGNEEIDIRTVLLQNDQEEKEAHIRWAERIDRLVDQRKALESTQRKRKSKQKENGESSDSSEKDFDWNLKCI